MFQGIAHLRVVRQPVLDLAKTAKHAVDGGKQQYEHGGELDQRFKGDRCYQPRIALLRRQVASAEQNGKHCDNDTKQQGQAVLLALPGEQVVGVPGHDLDTIGNGLDLQGKQWQQGEAHGDGDASPHPWTAEAKGEHIGQRGQLVHPAQPQQR